MVVVRKCRRRWRRKKAEERSSTSAAPARPVAATAVAETGEVILAPRYVLVAAGPRLKRRCQVPDESARFEGLTE